MPTFLALESLSLASAAIGGKPLCALALALGNREVYQVFHCVAIGYLTLVAEPGDPARLGTTWTCPSRLTSSSTVSSRGFISPTWSILCRAWWTSPTRWSCIWCLVNELYRSCTGIALRLDSYFNKPCIWAWSTCSTALRALFLDFLLYWLSSCICAWWTCPLRRRRPLDLCREVATMTTMKSSSRETATWDGDPVTWGDYARKVRLQWEMTASHKRRLLGPELASKLTGRAWSITPSLDHAKLTKRNGTKYLLRFLQERLCRTAIPDAGARLEDLLIRLRRPLGMPMSQWANEVMESYRKVQRALIRARQQNVKVKDPETRTVSEPFREPPSHPTSPKSPSRRSLSSPTRRAAAAPAEEPTTEAEDERGDYAAVPMEEEEYHDEPQWTPDEWKQWRKQQKREWHDDESSSGEDHPWDELQTEEIQVLPDEVLGWLLLRRANLSASSRLSVQASVNNSLRFHDLEIALRDQEEELLQADQQRGRHDGGKRRSYWVEEEGQWGLVVSGIEEMAEDAAEVHWVGSQLPSDVYEPSAAASNQETYDDDEIYWNLESDGWHGYMLDNFGYWMKTDGYGTFWSSEDPQAELTPEEAKELDEAYMAYENKARTFLQSRQLQKAKGTSRGFYPLGMMKGGKKGKGKGKSKKGKGFGTFSPSSTSQAKPLFAAQGEHSTSTTSSGCFICGDKGHGFRACPKRGSHSQFGKGGKKGTFWVEALHASDLDFIGMVQLADEIIYDTSGYGVLDLGATETVGSLEALETLMAKRANLHGNQEDVEVYTGASSQKPFRFGNGGVQFSSSYVLVHQKLGEQSVLLGMYTIDAERVPILIGMRTLVKLGAVIDVAGRWMVLANVAPTLKIPLAKSKAGHLLVNLTEDWLELSQPLKRRKQDAAASNRVAVVEEVPGDEVLWNDEPTAEAVVASVADVWMVEDEGEGDPGQEVSQQSVFLMSPDHTAQPLPSSSQAMRDDILQQLISDSSDSTEAHGAQAEQDSGHREGQGRQGQRQDSEESSSSQREVRLGSNRTSRSQRPSHSGGTLFRSPHRSSNGPGESFRSEQVCPMDSLRGVWAPPVLHSNLGISRSNQSTRPFEEGRAGPSGGEATQQGIHRAQEPEDLLRCSTTVLGEPAEECPGEEERVAQEPAGQRSQGRRQGGEAVEDQGRADQGRVGMAPGRGRLPRVYGPSSSGVRFDAFTASFTRRSVPISAQGRAGSAEPGDAHHTREKDKEVREASRRVGVQPTAGGMVHGIQPGEPLNDQDAQAEQQGTSPGMSQAVSHAFNSTSTTTPMASFDLSQKAEQEPENSFTSEGNLPSGQSSRSKRKKTSADDDPSTHMMDEKDTAFLVQEVDKFNSEIDELFVALKALAPGDRPPTVLELCCEEDSGLTKALELRGGRGIRCGLFNGCDLNKKSGFNKVFGLIRDEKPDAVWVALPCGPTSSIQELNMLIPEGYAKIQAKIAKSRKLAGKAVTLMEVQVNQGGEVIQEWPKYNKGWNFKTIQHFWSRREHHEAYVDGCAYDLRAPCGGLIKKPWRLKSATRRIWKMQKLCSCTAPHVPCEGGTLTRQTAFYPIKMCQQAARMIEEIHGDFEEKSFGVEDVTDCDMDCLKPYTDQEVQKTAAEVLKLHKKLGHPSRQAFLKMLRDRGAGKMIRTLASVVHCSDCQEAAIPPARRAVTLEQSTELWEVLQVDNMEVTIGDTVYHFQLIIDEASGYGAANFFFKHDVAPGNSRNATTKECIEALYRGWFQYFGYPKAIRLDKEGAHRGRDLEERAEGHGIEIQAVPAESHGAIGQVERLIGTIKRKLLAYLRSSDDPPEVAVWALMSAHNTMSNIHGYSPAQWVFGRNFSDSFRLFNGEDLPYWSGMSSSTRMQKQLTARLNAEQHHREFTLREKVNLAHNTQMSKPSKFYPGDLIYYKRFQAPADKRERSHQELDVTRRRAARWYGPGRVLAVETLVTYDGDTRQPGSCCWIIASGRLKKVHSNQLRHASDRERLIAEGSTQLVLPWTFQDLTGLINKGEYDDEVMTRRQQEAASKRARMDYEEQQRMHKASIKRQLEHPDEETGHEERATSSNARVRTSSPQAEDVPVPPASEDEVLPDLNLDPRHITNAELDVDRLLEDPNYGPLGEPDPAPLFRHPLFLQARQRHEQAERPQHVQRQELFEQRGAGALSAEDDMLFAEEIDETYLDNIAEYAFAVTLPTPQNEGEWRRIVKDPSRFVAKKLAKGVEVSWQKLSPEQRTAMHEAKMLEIKEWIGSKVCQAAIGPIPQERLMKMRWVLVLKGTDDPKVVKAKARLVVLGFTDPDLGVEDVRSPTLSRRGRQCMLQMCNHKGWKTMKSDAKAAFLQGGNSQQKRQIFGMPVSELREAMQLQHGQAIQFLKAAYGLTVAPKEFYHHVDDIVRGLGLHRLHVDPSIWVLRTYNDLTKKMEVHGMVGSHVDDFLLMGNEDSRPWIDFIQAFHASLTWSPWECPPMRKGLGRFHNPSSVKASTKWQRMALARTWLLKKFTNAEQSLELRSGDATNLAPNMQPAWVTFRVWFLEEIATPWRMWTSSFARSIARRMRRLLCMTWKPRRTRTS